MVSLAGIEQQHCLISCRRRRRERREHRGGPSHRIIRPVRSNRYAFIPNKASSQTDEA